ncbi:rhomboid family intramembrane serine protease [Chryseobacterium daecheongense]|uniref:rhomboid family intramembrane serine protease n=1 Tax=Chryseobacterium daecheongense TaxID=192389 RepID=UPI001FD6584D|nr:rhomboid family intramembrane serine protease [Chryseobacterium daecheongense]UOU99396.1 rhomboid family intramembrane serine protease [Chryseobacterium daecheongense]
MFNNIPPITRNIIIINVIVFIVSYFLPQLNYYLSGYYPFSPNFRSWQIITHMFMHGSMIHILFNMLTLWSFGPILEERLGGKKYLILYFLSGLGAFVLFNLWNFYEIQQLTATLINSNVNVSEIYAKADLTKSNFDFKPYINNEEALKLYIGLVGKMVGASGAIFGVVAAFATLYPEAKIGIMFIPVPMKVKYVMPIVIVVSIFLGISGNGGGIAHLAHVGGALVGWLLARSWKKHLYRFR